jgi:hypothetical protein
MKNPYIQYRRESDVSDMFSYSVLCTKTIDELETLLADDNLLPNDDLTNIDIIDRITEVIIEKENFPESQSEKEEMEFWDKFLVKHSKTIPLRLEDVKKIRKKAKKPDKILPTPELINNSSGSNKKRKWHRSFVAVTAVVAVVLVGNAITTFAYGANLLQAIISFTDDVLRKDYVNQEPSLTTSVTETPVTNSEYATLQEAFDAIGIDSPKAPAWLPEDFELVSIDTAVLNESNKISALFINGDKSLTITLTHFNKQPQNQYQAIEKNSKPIEIYSNNSMEFYLFTNIDRTVATWIDGMSDCTVEGDISFDELKKIIASMYGLEY